MRKRIVVISEYLYPNERTDAFLVTEIIKKFDEINNGNIKVICTSELSDKIELEFLENKIIRLKNSQLNENKIFLRILKFILLTLKLSFYSLVTIKKKDRVFLTTNPAFLLPIIAVFRKLIAFEYTLLVYDVFPENLLAAKIISNKGFLYKTIKKVYDWSYSQADRLIVLGRDMEEVVNKKTEKKSNVNIIENWCDYHKVIPRLKSDNDILQGLNIIDKKVFLFAGNLGRVQGIETLLEASSLVQNPDFVLLFIGDGAKKNEIVNFIEENNNLNVYYGGSFPIESQNKFLNACDVSIISLSDSMLGLGVPSKSYANMASAKPILCIGDPKSEIVQVVNEFNIGWTIEANNAPLLAKKIDAICLESDKFKEIGDKSRIVVQENYSKEIVLQKYAKLYEEKN